MQARQEDTHSQRRSFSSFCFKLSLFACVFLRPNFPCALLVRTSYTSLGEQSLCLAPRRWGRFVPFVLAKRPQRREARRSGCFRRQGMQTDNAHCPPPFRRFSVARRGKLSATLQKFKNLSIDLEKAPTDNTNSWSHADGHQRHHFFSFVLFLI